MAPDKIERLCLKAREAIGQRDWEKAKQVYLMALGLRSDLPDVHYGLATVYFQLRELTSAAHHFKEVTRLDPLRAAAHINLGAVYNLLGQLDDAVVALRRGIQLDPQRVEGYYNLGLVYRRKGQTDLAIQAYREALRLNPRMADAHLNLANLLFEKELYRLAENHYQQALQLRPGWEKALDGLDAAREAATLQENKGGASSGSLGSSGRIVKGGGSVLDQTVDPTVHATLLTGLHQTTIDSMDAGRLLQQILEKEMEPAIKELSSALLHAGAGGGGGDFDESVKKFEAALQHMRDTRDAVGRRISKLRDLQQHFPRDE